jgi:hypothetical protein
MRGILYFLIFTIILFPPLFANEYEFDVSKFKKKKLEFKGNLEFRPIINILDTDSHLFNLMYFQESQKKVTEKLQLRLELFPSLEIGSFKFFVGGNILGLTKNRVIEIDSNLYEAYIKYSPGKSLKFYAGKKVVKWGKGYAWNPVSFAGRQKDLNDTDANLEGFYMVYGEFIKSFSSSLKNIAVTTILLYNHNNLNRDFSSQKGFHNISQLYFLLFNTDLDFYFHFSNHQRYKIGFDFAGNILTNWEIHGEWSYHDGIHQILVGTRYLTGSQTTIIFEYIHNGYGFGNIDMDEFYSKVEKAIDEENRIEVDELQKDMELYYNKQFPMRDYLFCRVSQAEPFNILYFNAAIFSVFNINDKSLMTSLEFKSTRFKNLEFLVKFMFLFGKSNTEFGDRINNSQVQFRLKWFF